ncbi:flagellar export chaperone FliS [Legionella nagasakiensis]|uniref:flagellar export chaperone FliS n=1 Tax=Legionella nagasakiensis TaxID=535290 RepID=UPI001055B414|nr:flagellar export chaperone FliS [Legionella nagasakiensis]
MHSVQAYQDVAMYSEVLGASGHRQIQLLFNKLSADVETASKALEQQDIKKKCEAISKAHHIVVFLRGLLAEEEQGRSELEKRLDGIYGYLEAQLFVANNKNDAAALQRCREIINHLNSWWDNFEYK